MPDDNQKPQTASNQTQPNDEEASLDALAEKLSKWKEQMSKEDGNNHPSPSPQQTSVPQPQVQNQQSQQVQTVADKGNVHPSSEQAEEKTVSSVNPTQNAPQDPESPSESDLQDERSNNSKNDEQKSEKSKQPVVEKEDSIMPQKVQSEPDVSLPGAKVNPVTTEEPSTEKMDRFEKDIAMATAVQSKSYPKDINKLLQIAKERDASDLHISVGYPPTLRIHGKLTPIGKEVVTSEISPKLILPILAESKKDLLEVNREVDVAYEIDGVARFRVNVYHEKGRMAAAFRLIPERIKTLEELNLPKILRRFVKLSQGFVLITGPTGHGKTTTLASILQEINKNYEKHIITIEDPIEYVYPPAKALVTQREMHEDTHSWEIALRSAMREDPDVVLVGEMRDYETISAAITLAETGHLVFATLHTNSAAQTIDRIIDAFPENQQKQVRSQLAGSIEGVVSQRLVPVRTGGRMPACEIMLSTPAIRNLIREEKIYQIDNVIRTSLDVGMTSMENSLVDLVREGLISVEQAEEYASDPEEVIRLLR